LEAVYEMVIDCLTSYIKWNKADGTILLIPSETEEILLLKIAEDFGLNSNDYIEAFVDNISIE